MIPCTLASLTLHYYDESPPILPAPWTELSPLASLAPRWRLATAAGLFLCWLTQPFGVFAAGGTKGSVSQAFTACLKPNTNFNSNMPATISSAWTDEERLKVISALSQSADRTQRVNRNSGELRITENLFAIGFQKRFVPRGEKVDYFQPLKGDGRIHGD